MTSVALVTGGGSGIGAACARRFAAGGSAVVIVDRDAASAEAMVAELESGGTPALSVVGDVASAGVVADGVEQGVRRWGGLHAAVNAAGISSTMRPVTELSLADWHRTLAVNLDGVLLALQAELPAIEAAGGGGIVNVSSAAGLIGFAQLADYVASKHAVVGLTKSVALEYARRGVRVNVLCPGNVRTPMLERFAGSPEVLESFGRMVPAGRLAEPDEVAALAVWACGDDARYVIGSVLSVDGGAVAT